MPVLRRMLIVAMACVTTSLAAQERPRIADLSSLPDEEKTQVMVLATPHLAGMDGVAVDHLSTLVATIENWDPDIVALERLPAHEIAIIRSGPAYESLEETYVGNHAAISDAAQRLIGKSDLEAMLIMADWTGLPNALTEEEKRDRMLMSLAAYEMETALLYWRALGTPDALPEGLDDTTLPRLRELDETMNERVTLGVSLAERLGLSRLWSVDSHIGDTRFISFVEDLQKGIEEAGGIETVMLSQHPYLKSDRIEEEAIEANDLLPLYRFLNSEEFGSGDMRGQLNIYHRYEFSNNAGR